MAGIWPTDFAVLAAPRVKGTTVEAVFEAPAGGCRMTSAAVIVVLSTVPITSAVWPAVTAVAAAAVVSFLYAVDDVSSTVTFWPAEVTSVKPDVEMSLTVPIDPPAAGPERALDPPLPAPRSVAGGVAALAGVGLLLDVALTIPYAPPATAAAARPAAIKRDSVAAKLPKRREIVAYCRGPYCVYADDAVRLLQERGLKARRLDVGLPEWRRAGHLIETS